MAKVKICGITNLKDAQRSVDLGAWALGFIFYKKSPRYVSPSIAKKIIKEIPSNIVTVGVFVNEKLSNIRRIAKSCKLRAVQLHGNETPEFCRKLKKYNVIKAFRVNDSLDLDEVLRYNTHAYLFDTYKKGAFGGTGKTFKWKLIKSRKIKVPVFLSGGLNPKNISKAIKAIKPFAVDVSSGVERSPGKKCGKKLTALFEAVGKKGKK